MKCATCDEEKELNEFNKNKSNKSGVSYICKKCHSEYRRQHYLANKIKVIEQVNQYRLNNPDKYDFKKTDKINSFNKKAGRTIRVKCLKCENLLYTNKTDIDNNVKKYCSNECRRKDNKSPYHYYLKNIKSRVIKRNMEFNLTEEYLKDLLENKQNNKCAISNINIQIKHPNETTTLYDTASLDRIDNNKGYTEDNVQWVVLGINYMKLDFSNEELHLTLKLIKENYNN